MKYLTRTIWMLSLVSLFTDAASEMLYPIMPIYLKSIGFSVELIGVLEGVAEALAGLSKPYFGKWSDMTGKRLPFVQFGYGLSAISKPLMAVFVYPLWVFFARSVDRLGKGLRTGARDALLSDESSPETKGKVFGFHRSMDTFGAVIGPLFALIYLYYRPNDYKHLFLLAFIPGLLAILATFLVREHAKPPQVDVPRPKFFSFLDYWKKSPARYKQVMIGFLAFALFNSSDVFLLMRAKQSGLSDTYVIGVYIFYNLVYTLTAWPAGMLADWLGMKKTFLIGLALFACVYAGMAISGSLLVYLLLFAVYGFYAACTEGIAKAWISNMVEKKDTATAIGTYAGLQSLCALLASSLAGLIWHRFGAEVSFAATAVMTILVICYFLWMDRKSGGLIPAP